MRKNSNIKSLHSFHSNNLKVVSKEEQPKNLCSNNVGMGCSSLDVTSNKEKSTDELIDELATIFVESILWELEHGKHEKSSAILPSINKGTS